MEQKISKPARERLIRLARLLEQLEKSGKLTVSSAEIQNRTGWTSFTIRRDISMLGVRCANAAGYNVALLKKTIDSVLSLGAAEPRSANKNLRGQGFQHKRGHSPAFGKRLCPL